MKTLLFSSQLWQQMGANIGISISTLNHTMMEYEAITKERKVVRDKKKERIVVSLSRASKRYAED
jgi:hypothetical protein